MNPDEPIVPVSVPDAPAELDDAERDVFEEYAHKLAKMRVMTEADVGALTIFSRAWVEAERAYRHVREHGAIIETKGGGMKYNPHWSVKNKAEDKALKILAEFGMTPSSRTRVNRT